MAALPYVFALSVLLIASTFVGIDDVALFSYLIDDD